MLMNITKKNMVNAICEEEYLQEEHEDDAEYSDGDFGDDTLANGSDDGNEFQDEGPYHQETALRILQSSTATVSEADGSGTTLAQSASGTSAIIDSTEPQRHDIDREDGAHTPDGWPIGYRPPPSPPGHNYHSHTELVAHEDQHRAPQPLFGTHGPTEEDAGGGRLNKDAPIFGPPNHTPEQSTTTGDTANTEHTTFGELLQGIQTQKTAEYHRLKMQIKVVRKQMRTLIKQSKAAQEQSEQAGELFGRLKQPGGLLNPAPGEACELIGGAVASPFYWRFSWVKWIGALVLSCLSSCSEAVWLLINDGTPYSAVDRVCGAGFTQQNSQRTPLYYATHNPHPGPLQVILDFMANEDQSTNNYHGTVCNTAPHAQEALDWTISSKNLAMVEHLLADRQEKRASTSITPAPNTALPS
ncbi:hypothetical protein BJY01DRAFT_250950 [Aspergillus pseudoustus]|uniref:Ankyrin repeat-containing domain protein n=1 Tax=Aspergillus pseudoustus TaxID=1810923 RepID=A0ABR4JEK2_9EURO